MIRFLLLAVLLWMDCSMAAEPIETFGYAGAVFGDNRQDDYLWRVLRAALEHKRPGYGDFVLETEPTMPIRRQIRLLARSEPPLTVGVFISSAAPARDLVAVRIPIDRGLVGYRVLLIREADQPTFSAVRSLEDLRKFSFGLLPYWEDFQIMQHAGLTVVPGSAYEGLFRMLSAGRFDGLSRSANEVMREFDAHRQEMSGIVIEKHLLLHYPMPAYFWFSNSEDGRRRAERVRAGLAAMIEDGTLQTLFDHEFGERIKRLDLDHRLVIKLSNPLLDAKDPPPGSGLWYRPGAP